MSQSDYYLASSDTDVDALSSRSHDGRVVLSAESAPPRQQQQQQPAHQNKQTSNSSPANTALAQTQRKIPPNTNTSSSEQQVEPLPSFRQQLNILPASSIVSLQPHSPSTLSGFTATRLRAHISKLNSEGMGLLEERQVQRAYECLKVAEYYLSYLKLHGFGRVDTQLMATTHSNLSILYKGVSRLRDALSHCNKALRFEINYHDAGHPRLNPAVSHLNMCAILSALGRHHTALLHAECALAALWTERTYRQKEKKRAENKQKPDSDEKTNDTDNDDNSLLQTIAVAYHNLAVEQEFLRQFRAASHSYRRAASFSRAELGASHKLTKVIDSAYVSASHLHPLAVIPPKQSMNPLATVTVDLPKSLANKPYLTKFLGPALNNNRMMARHLGVKWVPWNKFVLVASVPGRSLRGDQHTHEHTPNERARTTQQLLDDFTNTYQPNSKVAPEQLLNEQDEEQGYWSETEEAKPRPKSSAPLHSSNSDSALSKSRVGRHLTPLSVGEHGSSRAGAPSQPHTHVPRPPSQQRNNAPHAQYQQYQPYQPHYQQAANDYPPPSHPQYAVYPPPPITPIAAHYPYQAPPHSSHAPHAPPPVWAGSTPPGHPSAYSYPPVPVAAPPHAPAPAPAGSASFYPAPAPPSSSPVYGFINTMRSTPPVSHNQHHSANTPHHHQSHHVQPTPSPVALQHRATISDEC